MGNSIKERATGQWGGLCGWEGPDWRAKDVLLAVIELTVITMFAVWVGRDYLNPDPKAIPPGREFMMAIQPNQFWESVRACGWCALWNSSTRGGYPALAEAYGAPLHPLVALTTLAFGIIDGAKIGVVFSLWIAGLAQWWIGRELNVGWLPRLWSALTAVAGGHLAGKMDLGVFTIVVSTATTSLVIAGVLHLQRKQSRRSIVILAIVAALSLVSGQGYMQLGLVITLPAFLFFILDEHLHALKVWKHYALAAGLGLLLAGVLILPVLHFLPNVSKPEAPAFETVQSIEYLPLNLVIADTDYYWAPDVLGKVPIPAFYDVFIGWVPIILAILGVGLVKDIDRKKVYYLAASVVLVFTFAGGILLKTLVKVVPTVAAVRFPTLAAGLAIPMILGLASYGLQSLMTLDWPVLSMSRDPRPQGFSGSLTMRWLLLIPLVLNLRANATFAHNWLNTVQQGDDVPWVIEALKTPGNEWVSPPFGEYFFLAPSIASGLKVTPGFLPWWWKDRELPVPAEEAFRGGPSPDATLEIGTNYGMSVFARPDEHYAAVVTDTGQEACLAHGIGGVIRVTCDAKVPGRLVVKENSWSGWKAWIDGERTPLIKGPWLAVEVPASEHTVEFRYLPWDVPLGIFLTVVGLVACGYLWFRPGEEYESTIRRFEGGMRAEPE